MNQDLLDRENIERNLWRRQRQTTISAGIWEENIKASTERSTWLRNNNRLNRDGHYIDQRLPQYRSKVREYELHRLYHTEGAVYETSEKNNIRRRSPWYFTLCDEPGEHLTADINDLIWNYVSSSLFDYSKETLLKLPAFPPTQPRKSSEATWDRG